MASRSDRAGQSTGAGRAGAMSVLGLAGLLLALAWPRLQASYHYLPVDTALGRYFETREIPTAQLHGLIERARGAIERHDHARYHEGLSLLHYLRALDEHTPYWEKRPELRRSLQAAAEAVRQAPASPRTWLRMAQVQAGLRAPDAWVLTPLRMSILTGRVEPTLLLARLELAYRFLGRMDEEQLALLRDQTALTWRVNPRGLLHSLDAGRLDMEGLRAVLADRRADILAEMEARHGPDA